MGSQTKHDHQRVLEYWNDESVESMYDKHLLHAEIELVRKRIAPGSKILDAGWGEGEGTEVYASIRDVVIHAADFSETMLAKARKRLAGRENVTLKQADLLDVYSLEKDYDVVVSQRCLINLMDWELQRKALLDLMGLLAPGGRLLLLEGSQQGVASLNELRAAWGLDPIPVKWHNRFFDDEALLSTMQENGYPLVDRDGLGAYFVLTRGIRPNLDQNLAWDCDFNRLAASDEIRDLLGIDPTRFSRLKLWVFESPGGS